MPHSVHVVCFGKDPKLLQTREAVLATEYRTTRVDTLVSLLKLSYERTYDAVVLCHSLCDEEYQQAVSIVRSCCPRAGIVALTKAEVSEGCAGSDQTLRGLDGPVALLQTVRLALEGGRSYGPAASLHDALSDGVANDLGYGV